MNMNYTIDHAEGKIILTKEFNKRAGILGTPEYKAMMKLRKDFPSYTSELKTISRNPHKRAYAKLTYDRMRQFISEQAVNPSYELAEFEVEKKKSHLSSSAYVYMKKWFLTRYPEYKTIMPSIEQSEETEADTTEQANAELKGA